MADYSQVCSHLEFIYFTIVFDMASSTDTMGLGKIISALSLILSKKAPVGMPKTTLVVAPVALLRQSAGGREKSMQN